MSVRDDAIISEEIIFTNRKPCLHAQIALVAHFHEPSVILYTHFLSDTRENLFILDDIFP